MHSQTFSMEAHHTLVVIGVQGNLQVKGWERAEALVKAEGGAQAEVAHEAGHLELSCNGDCVVRVPYTANLNVQLVQGNARVKLVEGQLQIEAVRGNLDVRNAGATQIGRVHGDLLARQVRGDLRVEKCSGNAAVRDVQGDLEINQVGGNLDVRDAEGDLHVIAGGNARLNLSQLLGVSYKASAGGNLHCQLPEEVDLTVDFTSGGERIDIHTPDQRQTIKAPNHQLALGDGAGRMKLVAGGNLYFACEESDWQATDDLDAELENAFEGMTEAFREQLAAQIESQIDSHLEMINDKLTDLGSNLAKTGLSEAEIERVRSRAQAAAEKASHRAEEQMRRAQEKLERKLAAAQRKAELRSRAAERRRQARQTDADGYVWSRSAPLKTPASEEERLLILKMLGEKKITVDQAEELLAALEGK